MRIESDKVQLLSGIRKGKTTGSPITFMVENKDWINWKDKTDIEEDILNPRPGHADLCGYMKYRLQSIRDVIERSSARETAMRVCIGALSKIALRQFGVEVFSFVSSIGKSEMVLDKNIMIDGNKPDGIESSPVRCPDKTASEKMVEEVEKCIKKDDSIGGSFYVISSGIIPGLGSYNDPSKRIDAIIAKAIISIPAIKAFEIGDGIKSTERYGTELHDEIFYSEDKKFYRKTNRAGGIEGGVTNGMPIVIKAHMKPIPTTIKGLNTVDINTKKQTLSLKERSDYCAVPSAAVVGESMLAVTLLDAIQNKFGKDSLEEMLDNYRNYRDYLKRL